MEQKGIFLSGEGDRWYSRNPGVLEAATVDNDPVVRFLDDYLFKSKVILEIGCSTGYRLAGLVKFGADSRIGIDPSKAAIEEGKSLFPELELSVGTADAIPLDDCSVDFVIFGFCLYLCEFDTLFQIASEANRVLRDGGFILIYDFFAEHPMKNPYKHHEGVWSHKMDFRKLFLWNPVYRELSTRIYSSKEWNEFLMLSAGEKDGHIISLLKKDEQLT